MTKRKCKGSGGGTHQQPARVGTRTKCPRCKGNVGHVCTLCDGHGWLPVETEG